MNLWEISNQCLKVAITDDWIYNVNSEYYWKTFLIFPSYPVLKIFVHLFVEPLKPLLSNVEDNISFLKINNCGFSISCDWCSIVNGVLETVRVNLNKKPELLDQVDFETLYKLFVIKQYVYFFDDDWPKERINKHCRRLFGNILTKDNAERLHIIAKCYAYAEDTEEKWCPFKRAAKLYYRNPKYMSLSERNIRKFGKIISKTKLVCHHCNDFLNQTIQRKKTDNYIFQPMLDYLVNISG
jgi:hypothetical protein